MYKQAEFHCNHKSNECSARKKFITNSLKYPQDMGLAKANKKYVHVYKKITTNEQSIGICCNKHSANNIHNAKTSQWRLQPLVDSQFQLDWLGIKAQKNICFPHSPHTHTRTQLDVDGGSCCCHYKFNIVSSESHTHPHSHLLQSIAHGKPFALRQATHLTAPTLGRAAWSNCVLRIAV